MSCIPPHLSGCGCSDFAEDRQTVGEHRRLAAPRLAESAFDAEQIAEVEKLRQLPADLADLLLADHHLNAAGQVRHFLDFPLAFALDLARSGLAGPVFDIEKMDLAALAPADDAAGDAYARSLIVVPSVGRARTS